MKYGYARVSTDDQNAALQLAALQKAGCQTVFKDEGLSGATTKRPALLRCLKKLEHGDTLQLFLKVCGSSTGWAAVCVT
jgi:DNA invertase Pin-like site-specific DNA recombinase